MQNGARPSTRSFAFGDAFYRLLVRWSRAVGTWIVRVFAFFVATGYFLFLPRRLGHSVRMYRALLPERGWLGAVVCAWRQYQDFAKIYAERLEIDRGVAFEIERDGEHHLRKARDDGRGAVLVMSHFGRWELSARVLGRDVAAPLTILMGVRGEQPVAADLQKSGVNVHAVPHGQAQAVDVFEAVRGLRQGEFVSLAADRAPAGSRNLRLPFLGGEVEVNLAPFVLALLTGAPLFVVFAYRVAPRRYRFECRPPRFVRAQSRDLRDAALREAALAYLDDLGAMMRARPEQWQTFGPFWLPAAATPGAGGP